MSWYLNKVKLLNNKEREEKTEEKEDKQRMKEEGCNNAIREDICL